MKLRTLVMIGVIGIFSSSVYAQYNATIYFDGNDTSHRFTYKIDTTIDNIWQVGKPNKNVFTQAATSPHALVTDTFLEYPNFNFSQVTFEVEQSNWGGGLLAVQWSQMLDMHKDHAIGIIEYSWDEGKTWDNGLTSRKVYNFYGWNSGNVDTLDSVVGFSGTDTLWRDIWFCDWWNGNTLQLRFTFKSDNFELSGDGWILDNFNTHDTWVHTVETVENTKAVKVYPTISDAYVNVQINPNYDVTISQMELIDINGKLIQTYGASHSHQYLDLRNYENGMYYLKVITDAETSVHQLIKID